MMTVLECGRCRWRVWMEAHHDSRGRIASATYRKIRAEGRGNDCPKCGFDLWRYIRGERFVSKEDRKRIAKSLENRS